MTSTQTHELSELVDIYSGGTPARSNQAYWDGNIPWISGKDMKKFRLDDSQEHITRHAVERGARCVGPGAILVLVRGMALFKGVPTGILTRQAAFNQDIKALIARDGVDPMFLAYAIAARQGQLQSFVTAAGHGTGRLITEAVETLPIWVPSEKVQHAVVEMLCAWDDAIATRERLVVAQERRFAWIQSQILSGRKRLPRFKKPWHRVSLSEVLAEHGLKSDGTEKVHSVSVHKGLINQIEHLGRSFAAESTTHYNRVLPGDLVYTKSPTGNFPLGIIKQSKIEEVAIVSPLYGVFTPINWKTGVFLDALFASPYATNRFLAPVVQKGAKNTIAVTNQNFLAGKLTMPTDPEEIDALASLAEAARAEIDAQRTELSHLQTQKKGLMQALLMGSGKGLHPLKGLN